MKSTLTKRVKSIRELNRSFLYFFGLILDFIVYPFFGKKMLQEFLKLKENNPLFRKIFKEMERANISIFPSTFCLWFFGASGTIIIPNSSPESYSLKRNPVILIKRKLIKAALSGFPEDQIVCALVISHEIGHVKNKTSVFLQSLQCDFFSKACLYDEMLADQESISIIVEVGANTINEFFCQKFKEKGKQKDIEGLIENSLKTSLLFNLLKQGYDCLSPIISDSCPYAKIIKEKLSIEQIEQEEKDGKKITTIKYKSL